MGFRFKKKSLSILLFILSFGFFGTAAAQEITVFADSWPPYNFEENNRIVGISTELVEAALQHANVQYKIVLHPFKRALFTVENTKDAMFFTVARIPQREDKFIWIGPLHPRNVSLYKLEERTDVQVNALEDLKKYRTGVLLGGSVEKLFSANNIAKQDYYRIHSSDQLLKLLIEKRLDLIPGDPLDLAYQMKQLGHKDLKLELAYHLSEKGGYYMIANKDTSKETIARIQESLDLLLATGARGRIIQKYLK